MSGADRMWLTRSTVVFRAEEEKEQCEGRGQVYSRDISFHVLDGRSVCGPRKADSQSSLILESRRGTFQGVSLLRTALYLFAFLPVWIYMQDEKKHV